MTARPHLAADPTGIPRPFTVEGLADRWGWSKGKIIADIRRGKIKAFRIGNLYRVSAEEAARLDVAIMKRKFPDESWIYFIRATESGKIKIGFSTRKVDRLRRIMTECPEPIEVLAAIAGTKQGELALHRRFASIRHVGEWFRPAPELLEFIRQIQ